MVWPKLKWVGSSFRVHNIQKSVVLTKSVLFAKWLRMPEIYYFTRFEQILVGRPARNRFDNI